MSTTLLATLGGLSGLAGWGISDWLTAKSSRQHDSFEVNAAVDIAGPPILLIIILISRPHLADWSNVGVVALGSVIFTAAYLAFIKALSSGAVGVVVPISNSFPLITLLLSLIFLSTNFTRLQVIAMIIIVLGAVLLAYEKGAKVFRLQKEVMLACAAAILWGLGFFFINTVVDKENWQVVQSTVVFTTALTAFALLVWRKRFKGIRTFKKLLSNSNAVWSGVVLTTGSILFFVAAERSGSIVIPAVIASAAPLVTSFLAAVFDKERLGAIRRFGAVTVVVGIILLNSA